MNETDTATTNAAKVHQVLTWLLEGNSEHSIREGIAKNWPAEESQPLILSALAALEESGKRPHAEVQNWCFEATRFVYQKQIEIGEYAGAMRAVRQLLDLSEGRNRSDDSPPAGTKVIEHHHEHTIGVITVENFEEHRRRIALKAAQTLAICGVSPGVTGDRSTDRPAAEAIPAGRRPAKRNSARKATKRKQTE